MRCEYKPDLQCCSNYYQTQSGGSIPYYSGVTTHRGGGIGSIFQGLFRSAIPFLKSIGRKVLPRLARAGVHTVSDVVINKMKPKEAFVNRAGKEVIGLLDSTIKGKKRKAHMKHKPKRKRRKLVNENF
jgi:hypothetical protein